MYQIFATPDHCHSIQSITRSNPVTTHVHVVTYVRTCGHICMYMSGFYLGIKFFWGGSLSITVNDCAQDMHVDLMHVLSCI